MKRLLVLLLTVIFTAGSLACCAPSHTNAPAAEPAEPAEAAVSDPAPSTVPTELSSAEASSNPSETAEPAAAPEDAPAAPSPVEDPGISFSASANLPLPNTEEDIPQGQPFTFGGTVYSDAPILEIAAVIGSSDGSEKKYSVSFSGSDNKTSVELVDTTFPSEDDRSLTAKVPFQEFPEGSYTFELTASNTRAENVPIASSSFNIVSSEWRSLISNNLRNNYAYALSFFGSRDEFMFRYKWRNDTDRGIKIDSAWRDARMINVVTPAGDKWKVHRKAASYYEDAINYLDCTFIRVRGEADSGVIRLWDLVSIFDGTLNIRFVYGRRFVSHHAFGTAIDLNSSMDPNWTDLSNRELILTEVRDHLSYNGIKTADNGTEYYDFTYDGSYETDGNNVPMTVVNYLLYELAFYRAGFHWGFYYDHTCDAMHFGLSEMPASIHDTSSRSLRKVYTYID